MRLAFIYGAWSSSGHKFNFQDIWTSPRGLTGSELSCFSLAREFARRGHDVSIFCDTVSDGMMWDGVKIHSVNSIGAVVTPDWDAAYSWNEPDALRPVHWTVIRLCNLQINSFNHCAPGYDDFVDVWTSPSDSHRRRIGSQAPHPHKWEVIPNGCDPDAYSQAVEKIPGRVIWASSPDRGLHWLLKIWPDIKREIPMASLRVFYHVDRWIDHFVNVNTSADPSYPEFARRAFFMKEAMRRIRARDDLDVQFVDSISRREICLKMSESSVLAFPCDTVLYTEGFSVTTVEACASRCLPVITTQDALGEIYGGSVPMVEAPVGDHLDEYKQLVIRALTDFEFRNAYLGKAQELAKQHSWENISRTIENLIRKERHARGWVCS